MSGGKKKDDRHKKTASLYVLPENSDEEVVVSQSANVTEEAAADQQSKAKSSDSSKLTCTLKKSQSARCKVRPSTITVRFNTNSMDWLEGTLLRRRSETRVYNYNTKLLEAIPHGDTAYIHRLLAMGANPDATCRLNHVSACHIAAMYDNDVLGVLIKAGAEIMRFDKLGRTPLHLAAWTGNIKHISRMLNFPEALVAKVGTKMSPKILEEVRRHSAEVNEFINTPCELSLQVTLPDSWSDSIDHNCREMKEMQVPLLEPGWNALHAASARVQHHCVQLLLAAGANFGAEDVLSRTPIDVIGCAHYMGQKIDAAHFSETLRILVKADGKFQNRTFSCVDTPLHTAVELDCLEAVEKLIECGAYVTNLNNLGRTPMHLCVKRRRKDILQFLANYEYMDVDHREAIVDTKDRCGCTVLRAAINASWTQGVCIALGAGASVTMMAEDGKSPIHAAAALGNLDIFKEILVVAQFNSAIDFRNKEGETALFVAIKHDQTEVVRLLLEAGANIAEILRSKVTVFHVAAEHGNIFILEYLLEYDSHITAQMINKIDQKSYTPLVYAVLNDHPECVELLISKGAVVNFTVIDHDENEKNKIISTTPLHIAARRNHIQIAKIIVQNDINTIHVTDILGRLPLHEACRHGNREIITLLLHKGADLCGQKAGCKTKFTPIDMLMNNLSKPTEFMQEMFDSYISSQGMNLQESNCEVTVNYGILVPKKSERKQMRVIKALVNTGNRFDQNKLLLHPLVQSFLYLKWKALLPFFYTILVLHVLFVLALNVYVVTVFYYDDKKKYLPVYLDSNIWKIILYVTVVFITIQEFIFMKIKSRRYFFCLETWLKIWAILLAAILPQVVAWEAAFSREGARLLATIALLLSWFEMVFLLSRFPDWGFYILMFGKVANKVFKILLSFIFLVFGFSISFMLQFRAEPPFEGPLAAFVKTMAMMTSEYDYQTTFNKDIADKVSASIIIQRFIFLTFLILVSIVLMNLIVGVAVNNVNHLEVIGNIKRLEKQVGFITSLEDIVCHKGITKILPKRIYRKWSTTQKLKTIIILRPREATCSLLPAYIREAIFEKAQLQKKQMDEEIGSMVFKMKLNEIHDAIVGKDETDGEKDDKSMSQVIEELKGLRSDMDFIKELLTTLKRRTLSSNKSSFL